MTIKTSPTLHSAIDDYAEQNRRRFGVSVASIAHRHSLIQRLKDFHPDIRLDKLDLNACVAMIDLWRNRPLSSTTGKPFAATTAQSFLSELIRFFHWLDGETQFVWTAPAHFGQISRRVHRLPGDRRQKPEVFSVEQLAVLYHHATPMQRLMLCLAMNCGMRATEMGRLKKSDFIFAGDDNILPGEGIQRPVHPRNRVCIEWLLWPETVEAVKWAIARAEKLGSDLLFVLEDGSPMWKEASVNPSTAFHREWHRLLKSVEDHQVPPLQISSIRKLMEMKLRRDNSDLTASLLLGHVPRNEMFYVSSKSEPLQLALRQLRTSMAAVFERNT